MKKLVAMAALAMAVFALTASAEEKAMDHGEMKSVETVPGETEAGGVGVINSVDADKGTVNITHEPMPELGWPTMTMDLPVTKKVDLGGIKAGEKVDFRIKLGRDKQYRVIEMKAAK
ncbi:MAG: copper-binding protein [Alphaproteobacteria bacterium]|nr:copper-binding protein [Alphaproteobacteria bacterium]